MNHHVLLSYFPKITPQRYQTMITYFKTVKKLWNAEIVELTEAGLPENVAHEFLAWRDTLSSKRIEENLEKEGIKTTSLDEEDYPKLLKQITDPPLTLFYKGKLPPENRPKLAVIGTRKHSAYAKQACEELTEELSCQGLIIVSGLAFGIDGIAHKSTLKTKGITLAVLGSGIDEKSISPQSHLGLARDIIQHSGAVISEYPPGTPGSKYTFPARNRIVAGMSLGTLVIEAPERSGSLITTRLALECNREVFAVPHPINTKLGVGNNALLKMGATLTTCADDVLDELNLTSLKTEEDKKDISLPPNQKLIFNTLSREPKNIEFIIKESSLPSQQVISELTLMEMKGIVKHSGGMNYTIHN